MEEYQNDGAVVRHYLLGELAGDEQRRFEEELMSGARSFEELLAAEDELVDQYVAGALAARERERFERHFLATPERRRKLRFARTLRRYVADASLEETAVEGATDDLASAAPSSTAGATGEESADEASAQGEPSRPTGDGARPSDWARFVPPFLRAQPPLARYALAAVLLLAVFAGALFVLDAARGPRTGGPVVAFTLTPGAVVRGASDGGLQHINIAPGTGLVELRLAPPAPAHRRYRADILTVGEDRPVFSAPEEIEPHTTDAGAVVTLRVPADLLTPGDYKLTLTAAPADGPSDYVATYYFRVTRQ